LGFAGIVVAGSLIATGMTGALFSVQAATQSESFTAGTVSLSSPSAPVTCTATALAPNGTASTCALQVTYTGTIAGFMALDVFIATSSGVGGEHLYNPGAADHPPTFSVTDSNSVAYTLPTTALGACPSGPFATANACYQTTNLLVSPTAFTSSSAAVTFTISVTIPTTSAGVYQGGTASVVITAHAVQASNNGSTSGCTAGVPCPGINAWS
jgi:hypothetical protein